jgi:hypothetical protein
MPLAEAQKLNIHAARTRVAVQADSSGVIPTEIEVLRAGMWPTESNKGMLYITPEDLAEYVTNFKAGVGMSEGLNQLAIDFMHEPWDQAAGWITDLKATGDVLIATVEWTKAGLEALEGKMFKLFSPSFYPSCLGEWCDAEDWSITAKNVLVGGALTNQPFFKSLSPIAASVDAQDHKGRTLFLEAESERSTMPKTLDEVRVMATADLTDEYKALLEQNKAKLSADEKKKFGLEDEVAPVEATQLTADQKQVIADIASGKKVLVDASEHDALKAKVDAMGTQLATNREKEVKADVLEHGIKRGAIKADQAPEWEKRILADASMLQVLKDLNPNPLLASELGNDKDAGQLEEDELNKRTIAAMEASRKEHATNASVQVLSYRKARSQVITAAEGSDK